MYQVISRARKKLCINIVQVIYSLIVLGVLGHDPINLNTNSYTPNVIIDDGIARMMCGVRPPYNPANPSCLPIDRKHCTRPTYFEMPFSFGACRSLVLTT